MENAVMIRPVDSVVTVTEAVPKGGAVSYPGCTQPIVAAQVIPIYHKVAVTGIKEGNDVFKYGEKIGVATKDINVGEHVHTHNIASVRA